MSERNVLAILTLAALAASNFAYQAVADHDWSAAIERSWFQAVAIGVVMLAIRNV